MIRSEIHVIRRNHELFKFCDEICFKSKNLYNYTNYIIRQEFINNHKMMFPFDLNKQLKHSESFLALPAKTAQMTIMKLGSNWKSYFIAIKDWAKNKEKYTSKPKLPNYKKKDGRFLALFDAQQIKIENELIYFQEGRGIKPFRTMKTKVKKSELRQIQVFPYGNCYKISVVYKRVDVVKDNENSNYLAIDLGVNNLATLTNNIGNRSIVINGRILKSKNNYYNKIVSKAMSYVGTGTSNRISRIATKRNNIIDDQCTKLVGGL